MFKTSDDASFSHVTSNVMEDKFLSQLFFIIFENGDLGKMNTSNKDGSREESLKILRI